jgi:hypothetical protein
MTTPVFEQALDDAIADNAQLERNLEQLGQSYVEAAGRLRRAGQALLDLERVHPELAGEIDAARTFIWPERRRDDANN